MKPRNCVSLLQIFQFVAVGLWLVLPTSARAQAVVATIPLGTDVPRGMAVNPVTNKIYVASCTFHGIGRPHTGSLTVIDGATNATTVITGVCPMGVAVNSMTNKIYVPGAVIDGATNSVTTLSAWGRLIAVNPVTNKIYLASALNDVSPPGHTYVIDGATNSITTAIDPNAFSLAAAAIAVNPVTNKIYVANNGLGIFGNTNPGNMTVIDGATNSTTTLTDPNAIIPQFVAVNPVTNKVYVTNAGDLGDNPPGLNHGNITVIDGTTNAITTLTDPNVLLPQAVAVNQSTNKIYVAIPNDSALTGNGYGSVAVIDGATNAISIVKDPNEVTTQRLAVDSMTNTIYVTNSGCPSNDCSTNPYGQNPGSVTVINGATNSVTTVINANGGYPGPVAINPATNKIYVLNNVLSGGGNVSVIDGGATPTSHLLWVLVAGNESGAVTSNPAGVNCGTSCTASFAPGTAVNLTASPAPGSTFSGWSDACSGAGSCNLTLNSDEFATATFGSLGDFLIQPASVNLTAQSGGQVTDIITVAPVGGFTAVVQLSCAVSPAPVNPSTALATCSLSPTSVTPGANSATSTLTVTAPSQSARLILPSKGQLSSPLYAAFLPIPLALIALGLASGKSKNRRRSLWLFCSLLPVSVAALAGCGAGNSSGGGGVGGGQTLNYTVTVTATSGTIQHSNLVSVTVP